MCVNRCCLKCISGVNLPNAHKNMFTMSLILYLYNKISPNNGILLKGVFNPMSHHILIKSLFFLCLYLQAMDF